MSATRPGLERTALGATTAAAIRLPPAQAARLQQLAADLLPEVETLAEEVNRRAIGSEPALADAGDPVAVDTVLRSTRANVGAILSMLAYGVPADSVLPADGALGLYARLAGQEDGLAVVLRGYRLGIMELWQIWARHLRAHTQDADELHALLAASTAFMFTYVDRISVQLTEGWTTARRRGRHGLDTAPEDLIGRVLGGDDETDLTLVDYDLTRTHVAIALDPTLDDAELQQLVSALRVEALAQAATLRLDAAWLLWLGLERPLTEPERTRLLERLSGHRAGIGQAGAGPEGFRRTHREALDARRVGLLRRDPGLTLHRDVALLAVLCADLERGRALAAAELGPLAAADQSAGRLRATLRAFLAANENQTATAHVLDVHQKTVAYRLRQAEGLLGRTVNERRVELEAALLIHHALED